MTYYRICHDTPRFDIVSSHGVYRCSCGRKYRCVMGSRFGDVGWEQVWSWARLAGMLRGLLR